MDRQLPRQDGNLHKKNEVMPEIKFQPITEGLGFHPFSDGLPYAPISKNSRPTQSRGHLSKGTGAVSAGPPIMSIPGSSLKGILSSQSQLIQQSIPRISVPVAKPNPPSGSTEIQFKKPVQSPPPMKAVSRSINEPMILIEHDWVYLAKRMTAYCIDVMINALCFMALVVGVIIHQDLNIDIFANQRVIVMTGVLLLGFHWFFILFQEIVFRTSFGKWMLKLALRGSAFELLIRAILFLPSVSLCGIGILSSVLDVRKRCWHDKIVGIQPIEY